MARHVRVDDFVNDFEKFDEIGRSAEIGRSGKIGDNAMPPPRPRQRTLKLTDNAMKLMEKDMELFRGIFNFVNKPPKPPHFDENRSFEIDPDINDINDVNHFVNVFVKFKFKFNLNTSALSSSGGGGAP